MTYGTTDQFLEHFGIDSVRDLPGLGELRGAGLLSAQLPPDFSVPQPNDVAALMPDELPLEEEEESQESLDLDEETDEENDDEAMDNEAGDLHEAESTDKSDPPSQ